MRDRFSLGKLRGLRRLADEAGLFAMLAIDQRPPIAQLVAARRGIAVDAVAFADMACIKRLVVEALAPYASAILLDPNFGFPATLASLPARPGLMVTLEDHRFEDSVQGRRSHAIANWSVAKIKRCGADAVKLLAWYRPDAHPDVREHQQAFVAAIGEQCRQHDIPLVLELLVYPLSAAAGAATKDPIHSPEQRAQLVLDSVAEFAKRRYAVDLFKLESPLLGATLKPRDAGPSDDTAQRWFDDMASICRAATIPWVMLSAGVSAAQFKRVMEYAFAAGASGFLAGRAIWWEPLQPFPDVESCRERLRTDGAETLRALNELAAGAGSTWHADYSAITAVEREGDVCASYSAT